MNYVRPNMSAHDPSLGLFCILQEDGTPDPVNGRLGQDIPVELKMRMFSEMLRVRILDERMLARQRQGKIGFFGTITGQEATPIATGLVVEEHDWVFPALRENAIMLVRGFPLTQWLGQVYGNSGDVLKGRQMPSHMSGRSVHQVAWSSCIGPQLPQAVGAAWAAKLKGDPTVVFGFMGDGATSQPDFHCAMNFAAVYKVPVVLVCQNNHWSISVPTAKQTVSETIAVKAKAYGIPGIRVDGNDVLALHSVLGDAAKRARSGGGATFVESVTYRIGAHSSSDDPSKYRSEEEVERWRKRDPILRMEKHLRTIGALDDARKQQLAQRINDDITAAIAEVEPLPLPSRDSLFDDVYGTLPWHLEAQRAHAQALPPAPSHG